MKKICLLIALYSLMGNLKAQDKGIAEGSLKATGCSGFVKVEWAPAQKDTGVSLYELQRKTAGGEYKPVVIFLVTDEALPSGSYSFKDRLVAGSDKNVSYRIMAVKANNELQFSTSAFIPDAAGGELVKK